MFVLCREPVAMSSPMHIITGVLGFRKQMHQNLQVSIGFEAGCIADISEYFSHWLVRRVMPRL